MHLTLFGPPSLTSDDGQPASLDTRKALALAAYLAATGTAHSRDHLAALLWPESDGSRAKGALRRTLSTLKSALGGRGLEADGESIALRPDDGLAVDVWDFHAALADSASHDHPPGQPCPRCAAPLHRAVDRYSADFLAGFSLKDSAEFDDWQYFQAESLRREFVSALDRLVAWESGQQRWETAIECARRRLAVDNLHEPAHRQLMRLYAVADQRAVGLRQYRECVQILDEELGVPPLNETTELYEAIQAHRLAPPPVAVPAQTSPPVPTRLPLVGRDEEWEQMRAVWQTGAHGRLLVLTGEAGIGKSRLLDELLTHAQSQRASTALARCFPGENSLAFGVFLEAVRPLLLGEAGQHAAAALPPWQQSEVARLFPGLLRDTSTLPPAPPLDSPGGQARFFQALADLLAALFGGEAPGVLAFDDLHWADRATLDLLTWLARRLHGLPFCLALAWRSGESGEALLQPLAQTAQRSGSGVLLTLSRLRVEDVERLVASGSQIPGIDRTKRGHSRQAAVDSRNQTLARRLHAESEGIPFLLAEQLALLADAGENSPELRLAPASVRELFATRLASLDGMAAQTLSSAAVIGRSFDLETVQAAAGRSEEESLLGLESLLQRRLVVEQAGEGVGSLPRYDFCHEKLRELVYDETALARRRLLHRRVAESLGRQVGRRAGVAAQTAWHHRWAGQEAEAARLYSQAGDEARRLYANAESLAHYRTALALGHPETSRLHRSIGELLTLAGEYAGALLALEQAAAGGSGVEVAEVEEQIGGVYQRQGAWQLAEEHYRAGLDALAIDENSAARARLLSALSHTAHRQGDDTRALPLAEAAQAAALSANDTQAQADVANLLGLLARSRGDNAAAIRHLQASLESATALADPSAEIATRNNLALALADDGDFAAAQAHLLAALARCAAWGDRHREAALRNNLADLLHRAGENEQAMAQLKQGVTIFAEIGEQGALPLNAEIWKLTEW